MPLNPNGKIDKPALPFPDTAQASYVPVAPTTGASPTEIAMQNVWSSILPNAPKPIPTDENFFDLGGHSILATRLIFEIRKVFVIEAPLGLIFEEPTIAGLVQAVDTIRNADLGFADKTTGGLQGAPKAEAGKKLVSPHVEYGQDYIVLLEKLRPSYPALPTDFNEHPITVFLTGATGFLGAFILNDLLSRDERVKKVICLVRAKSVQQGVDRLKEGSTDRGVWSDDWVSSGRLEVVTGDLGLDLFGLDQGTWARVAHEADAVLHNGALVKNFHYFTPCHFYLSCSCRSIGFFLMRSSVRPMFLGRLLRSISQLPGNPKLSCSSRRHQRLTLITMFNYLSPWLVFSLILRVFQKVTISRGLDPRSKLDMVNPNGCLKNFFSRPASVV